MDDKSKDRYLISDKITTLSQALVSGKNKVAILMGAGCPLSVDIGGGKKLIPDLKKLTEDVCAKLNSEHIDMLKEGKDSTIEDILTRARLLISAIGDKKFDGADKNILKKIVKDICSEITTAVDKKLPNADTPYHTLASWISEIPRENPVEVFTLNYDLLMESVFESEKIPYFDGFVGAQKAFFDLHSMEFEEPPSRWVRLWKLHGSVNWWIDGDNNVFRGNNEAKDDDKQMIYPSHLKYSQSRRMPYLAMQDRLSKFISGGQSVLITIGYSFSDQHLNEIIEQRLLANPTSVCFGLLYDNIECYPQAVKCAGRRKNLHLLARDSALFCGKKSMWKDDEGSRYRYLTVRKNTKVLNENIECKIGDFNLFSQFLTGEAGDFNKEMQDKN